MTTASPLAAVAARNRAARLAQIERLRPVYHAAKDAAETLRAAQAQTGELRAGLELMRDLRWIPGFFPTPPPLVAEMLARAALDDWTGRQVLEPSAGKGDIAQAARRRGARVQCCEVVPKLAAHLRGQGLEVIGGDFLAEPARPAFDLVLMNPPFERRRDVAHVRHAAQFLKPGGRLVAIVSSGGAADLDPWLAAAGGESEPLPAGAFRTSERPTGVNCAWIIYDAPKG